MIKVNKSGWLYICLTIAIGLAAVNTGNNLIFITDSALLSYMLLSGVFGRRNLFSVDIELEFPREVFAHRPAPVLVRLINRSRFFPAFLIEADIEGQRVFFPYADPKSSVTRSYNATFEARGRWRIETLHASSVFPFNYFTRYREIKKRCECIVLPEPKRCAWDDPRSRANRQRGDESSNALGHDADIISIRDYIPGDPIRYISWKSTAKTGRLKTREHSSIEKRQVMIDFDKTDKRRLEYVISCATYTILKLLRAGSPVGLVIGGKVYKPGLGSYHRWCMLRDLALYGKD